MADRIARLPKWAQRLIEGLERRIDEPDDLDIHPGAVNSFQLTRREIESMKRVDASIVRSIPIEAWRRLNRG